MVGEAKGFTFFLSELTSGSRDLPFQITTTVMIKYSTVHAPLERETERSTPFRCIMNRPCYHKGNDTRSSQQLSENNEDCLPLFSLSGKSFERNSQVTARRTDGFGVGDLT
jgi:hypothetical protein